MNEMFSQGGKGSTGILTNKQAIARKFGVKQNEVVYFAVGVDLGEYKVIYDKTTQRAYSLPADLGSGVTAVSLNTAGVLVHSTGNVDLGALAVSRGEFITVPGSFSLGYEIKVKNECLEYQGGLYRWDGALPKVVDAGSVPDIGTGKWLSVGDAALRSQISDPDGASSYPELQMARWRDEGDVRGWGAKGDGVTDSTENIAASLNSQKAVVASDGVFSSSGINSNYCNLDGRGSGVLSHRSSTGNYLVFNNLRSGRLSNITVESNKATDTTQGQQVSLAGGSDVTISDVNFSNVKGAGFSLITYPNDAPSDGLMIKGIRGSYSGYATNKAAGCILADSSVNSLINNVIAKNYPQFGAVELKGTASYNIVSNVIGADCQHVTYNGTKGSIAPSNNLINGVVANNPKYAAVVAGKGSTNLISDVLVDFSISDASQAHGVTVEGSDNVISNVLMSGCDGTNSLGQAQTATIARFIDTANNNYASVFPSYSATGVITFESGSTRNFVEVKHPGRRNDLLSATGTIEGAVTIDGTSNSNVVHAPALGQYIGSMSGRFEWRIKSMSLPSGVLTSADKYRMLGDGAVSLAVGGGTSSQVRLFTSDGTSRTVSLTNGNVRLPTSSTGYLQLGSDAMTPDSTNTYALGSASRAWSGGFTQSAFTVVSDARDKTEPLNISDALLDAWSEVDFVQFQYLDRIEEKGADSARWHFGIIAQRAKEAFERHGIDAHRYGFLCFDSWDDVYEEDANGSRKLITPAGSRYGIRYEEVLILEAALMRRTIKRMQEALAVMSK
ncbi:K5 lyase [Escherichia phage UE-S5b]